jgi:hypothetical protein
MRKTYITPAIAIIRIQPHHMLALSDAASRSLNLNTDGEVTDDAVLL